MSLISRLTTVLQSIGNDVQAILAAQPGAWTNVTYAANCSTHSATYNAIQVRNNGDGTCTFRGRAKADAALAASASIWTVPVGFRPAKAAYCGLINSAQGIVVGTNGVCTTAASVNSGVAIQAEGVSYSL